MKIVRRFIKTIDKYVFNKFFQDRISRKIFTNFYLTSAEISNIQRWIFFFEMLKNNNVSRIQSGKNLSPFQS